MVRIAGRFRLVTADGEVLNCSPHENVEVFYGGRVNLGLLGVKGKEAEASLDRAHITVNKNSIPFDVNPPLNPSGIRLGTAALTTRGFGNKEFEHVASLIAEVLADPASEAMSASVRKRVYSLTQGFPLYSWRLAPAGVS